MANRIETKTNAKIESNVWNNASYLLGKNGIVANYFQQCNVSVNGLTANLSKGVIVLFGKNIIIDGTATTTVQSGTNVHVNFYVTVDMSANTVTFHSDRDNDGTSISLGSDDLFINPTGKYSLLVASATVTNTTIVNVSMNSDVIITPNDFGVSADILYPVGSIEQFQDNTFDPNVAFEGQVWAMVDRGFHLVTGNNSGDNVGNRLGNGLSLNGFLDANATALTVAQMPTHNHTWSHNHTMPNHTHTHTHAHNHIANTWTASSQPTIVTIGYFGASGTAIIRKSNNERPVITGKNTGSTTPGKFSTSTSTLNNNTVGNVGNTGNGTGHGCQFNHPVYSSNTWVRVE